MDALNFVKQTVGAVSQTPTTFVKDLVSDAIAPKYWVPNSEIKVTNKVAVVNISQQCQPTDKKIYLP